MEWCQLVEVCRNYRQKLDQCQLDLAREIHRAFGLKSSRPYGGHTIDELAELSMITKGFIYELLRFYEAIGEWWESHPDCPVSIMRTTLRYFPKDPEPYLDMWLVRGRPTQSLWESDLIVLKGDPDESERDDVKQVIRSLMRFAKSPTVPSFRGFRERDIHELYVALVTGSEWARSIENVVRDRKKRGKWKGDPLPKKKELKKQLKKGMDSKKRSKGQREEEQPENDHQEDELRTHDGDVIPLSDHGPLTPDGVRNNCDDHTASSSDDLRKASQTRFICGLVCDLVAAKPGLSSSAYLDAVVITLGWDRYCMLLIETDRTLFLQSCEQHRIQIQTMDRIAWREVLSRLTLQEALVMDGEVIRAGPEIGSVKGSFPHCDGEFITLILKAAAALRDHQRSTQTGSEDRETA